MYRDTAVTEHDLFIALSCGLHRHCRAAIEIEVSEIAGERWRDENGRLVPLLTIHSTIQHYIPEAKVSQILDFFLPKTNIFNKPWDRKVSKKIVRIPKCEIVAQIVAWATHLQPHRNFDRSAQV